MRDLFNSYDSQFDRGYCINQEQPDQFFPQETMYQKMDFQPYQEVQNYSFGNNVVEELLFNNDKTFEQVFGNHFDNNANQPNYASSITPRKETESTIRIFLSDKDEFDFGNSEKTESDTKDTEEEKCHQKKQVCQQTKPIKMESLQEIQTYKRENKFIKKQTLKKNKKKKIKKNKKSPREETKNLLRNYGAAQTNFIKHHTYALNIINKTFKDMIPEIKKQKINEFYNWCPKKLETFSQFQTIWSNEGQFYKLYKKLCSEFYQKFAVQYIYSNSRISQEHRITHLKYVYRFCEGIANPDDFYYFKKIGQ